MFDEVHCCSCAAGGVRRGHCSTSDSGSSWSDDVHHVIGAVRAAVQPRSDAACHLNTTETGLLKLSHKFFKLGYTGILRRIRAHTVHTCTFTRQLEWIMFTFLRGLPSRVTVSPSSYVNVYVPYYVKAIFRSEIQQQFTAVNGC